MPPRAKSTDSTIAENISTTALTTEELLTQVPDDWEFETVIEQIPSKLKLEVGDSVILRYERTDHIINPNPGPDDEDFDLLIFTGRDGEPYSVNPSHRLAAEWGKIQPGDWVRITLKGEIARTKGNPLKDYKVERAVKRS